MSTAMLLCVFLTLPAFASAEKPAGETDSGASASRTTPRIRPIGERADALVRDAISRSAVVRNLIAEIDQHSVIVYVELLPKMPQRLSGALTWMTGAGEFRYVRVSLNASLSRHQQLATLGHELQHAVEIAHAPEVVDPASLERFYRMHGVSVGANHSGWDTEAARAAGMNVRREVSG